MQVHDTTTDDGMRSVRLLADRIVTWDGRMWRAEYLQAGAWHSYPTTIAADPTGGELYREGREVLAKLLNRIGMRIRCA